MAGGGKVRPEPLDARNQFRNRVLRRNGPCPWPIGVVSSLDDVRLKFGTLVAHSRQVIRQPIRLRHRALLGLTERDALLPH
jgi:hypothetical protein